MNEANEIARLRAEVSEAGSVLFPLWPLSSFIAVNPLGDLGSRPIEDAVAEASRSLGAAGRPDGQLWRDALERGRITEADLGEARERARREGRQIAGAVDPQRPPEADAMPAGTPAERVDDELGTTLAALVDSEMSRWCSAFLDDGQAVWSMPQRELGFYRAWKELAAVDRAGRLDAGDLRPRARALPAEAGEALLQQLTALGAPPGSSRRRALLRRLLGRSPGWPSAIRWRARAGNGSHPIDLVEYLAVQSFYELALVEAMAGPATGRVAPSDAERDRSDSADWLWLEAYEWNYRDRLLSRLAANMPPRAEGRPAAQAVFCIDARSEGMRRHLESCGSYETLGFAGFFALAVSHRPLGADVGVAQCPVLLSPTNRTGERPVPGAETGSEHWVASQRREAAEAATFHQVKNDLSSKFALAEFAGWGLGPAAAARTIAPELSSGLRRRVSAPAPVTEMVIDRPTREEAEAEAAEHERSMVLAVAARTLGRRRKHLAGAVVEALRLHLVAGAEPPPRPASIGEPRWGRLLAELATAELTPRDHERRVEEIGSVGFTPAEAQRWAHAALTMMGLTEGFARLVLLCAHGATAANNPYASALDCGACGGNAGAPNARLAAALLNRPAVRDSLRETGIDIPADTVFLAGQHDTTTDEVQIFDRQSVPLTHRADLLALERDLARAGESLTRERLEALADGRSARRRGRRAARRRAHDWAQVRPEWGLARNAAFIVGPREMTAGLDLGCRTFLHSYRAEVDPGGTALETILTAPLVVAEWINLQYYFSTTDPEVFGAGDKTLHNVVGNHGVVLGPGGDLRLGLPRQSVFDGSTPHHEPMRLLAVVQAPIPLISEIIERNPVLVEMLGGGWVAMCAREKATDPWRRLRRDLEWEAWRPAGADAGPGERETEPTKERAQWHTRA